MTKPSKTKANAKNKSKAKKTKARLVADAAEVSARCDLSKTLLQAYENEYADRTSFLENIERKARAVMVIAGVMLAAGLVFVGQLDASISSAQQWLLVGVIATLMFTLWQCARALKTINEDTPPTADFVRQLGADALQSPDKSQLPDLIIMLQHAIGINIQAGFSIPFVRNVREHMHTGGVEPDEKRLAFLLRTLHEIHGSI